MARLSILVNNYLTSVECLSLMDKVTLDRLHEFAQEFFKCIRIVGLIQGNISKDKAIELCNKFEGVLHCTPLEGEKPNVSGDILFKIIKNKGRGEGNSLIHLNNSFFFFDFRFWCLSSTMEKYF